MVDLDHEPSDNKGGHAAAAPPVESPLSKLLAAIFGGGKKNPSASRPAPSKTAAGMKTSSSPAASGEAAAAAAFAGGPLMTVVVRNEFYRDGFRNMLRIAIAESIIIVALIVTFIVYMNASKPQDHYFATTADGRIMQLVPLNLPNMGTSALMSWVAQSSTEVMTFGFHDYQRRMQQSSRHFTRHGWESFTNALQKSRIIEAVESSRQVVTAQPRSAPILIQEGVFNGKYRWVVDLPLAVTYQAGTATRTDNLTVRLVIDRVPSLENPNGVGIEQWIATQS
ncbi:MAG: type IVB secretion system apparatus protein IcmL/DotI [Alphaproteobacteria bacterium]|nr:type IVB secretion system apparatus protein IcmL/DotI [Alphaproteobacteria bacterium]